MESRWMPSTKVTSIMPVIRTGIYYHPRLILPHEFVFEVSRSQNTEVSTVKYYYHIILKYVKLPRFLGFNFTGFNI